MKKRDVFYREIYGDPDDCLTFPENKQHGVVPWKEFPFAVNFVNETKYTVQISKGKQWGRESIALLPEEERSVVFHNWSEQRVEFEANYLHSSVIIQRGIMIERSWVPEGTQTIIPTFCDRKISLRIGKNHLEKKVLDGIKSMHLTDFTTVLLRNKTGYELVLSNEEGLLLDRIQKNEVKTCKLPRNGVVYIDTLLEEILYKDSFQPQEGAKYLHVNGCAIELRDENISKLYTVLGPAMAEPYVRWLYIHTNEKKVTVYCQKIDWRIE